MSEMPDGGSRTVQNWLGSPPVLLNKDNDDSTINKRKRKYAAQSHLDKTNESHQTHWVPAWRGSRRGPWRGPWRDPWRGAFQPLSVADDSSDDRSFHHSIISRQYKYYASGNMSVIMGRSVLFEPDFGDPPYYQKFPDEVAQTSYCKYIISAAEEAEGNLSSNVERERQPAARVKIIVYRIGPGMYHSGISVNDLYEWHFFEGSGVKRMPRIQDEESILEGQGRRKPALAGLPVVEEVLVDGITHNEMKIFKHCCELSQSAFSAEAYDLLRNNCNHFTSSLLELCNQDQVMPKYVNRMANAVRILCSTVPGAESLIFKILGR